MDLPPMFFLVHCKSAEGSFANVASAPLVCVTQLHRFSLFPALGLSPIHFLHEHKLPSTFITSAPARPLSLSKFMPGLFNLQPILESLFIITDSPFLFIQRGQWSTSTTAPSSLQQTDTHTVCRHKHLPAPGSSMIRPLPRVKVFRAWMQGCGSSMGSETVTGDNQGARRPAVLHQSSAFVSVFDQVSREIPENASTSRR